jgi:hypothetical protein
VKFTSFWAAENFRRRGFVIIDGFLSSETCDWIFDEARECWNWIHKQGISSGYGESLYDVLPGDQVVAHVPALTVLYEALRPLLEAVSTEEVILSPWVRSSINVKWFQDGGSQGEHFDSNPLTALIYLTDSDGDLVITSDGEKRVEAKKGRLVILSGKAHSHRVEKCTEDRIAVVMNYYYPRDCDRPEWLDKAIYENLSIGENPELLTQ